MRPNMLRTLWAKDRAAVNGWATIPSSFSAEIMAHAGWDSVTVDMQHGVTDYQAAANMLAAIGTTDAVPMVRVPWLEPGIIMKSLDAGAYGVICPMVNDASDARALVSFSNYPPRGNRSFGPVRATLYGGADYPRHANDTIVAFAMIETARALDNIDDILAVEGLEAIYVGPADLSLGLGCTPKFDQEDPKVLAALDRIVGAAKRHGVIAGIHCGTPAYAKRMIDKGFRLVTLLSDARLITARATELLAEMRGTTAAPAAGSY